MSAITTPDGTRIFYKDWGSGFGHHDRRRRLGSGLSPDHARALGDASAIEPGFPERLYAMELPRTFAYGGMRDQIIT